MFLLLCHELYANVHVNALIACLYNSNPDISLSMIVLVPLHIIRNLKCICLEHTHFLGQKFTLALTRFISSKRLGKHTDHHWGNAVILIYLSYNHVIVALLMKYAHITIIISFQLFPLNYHNSNENIQLHLVRTSF